MRFLWILPLVASLGQARVLHVPLEFPAIQGAIDAVSDGDTVLVEPGVWRGGIDLGTSQLVLRSRIGPEWTILDGDGEGSVIRVAGGQDEGTVVEGFTVCGGKGTVLKITEREQRAGGGILCRSHSSPTIRGNILRDNRLDGEHSVGGGVFAWNSSPRLEGNLILGNRAGFGGGLFLQASDAVVVDNRIEANATGAVGKGGGLRSLFGSPSILGNTFRRNAASWIGSAIAISEAGSRARIEGNLLVENLLSDPLDIAYGAHGDLACNGLAGNQPDDRWPVDGYWCDLGGNWVLSAAGERDMRGADVDCRHRDLAGDEGCGSVGANEFGGAALCLGEDVGPPGLRVGRPGPPLARGEIFLPLRLEAASELRLSLLDLAGRERLRLLDGRLDVGEHLLPVDTEGLRPGLYLLLLEGRGVRVLRKLALIP